MARLGISLARLKNATGAALALKLSVLLAVCGPLSVWPGVALAQGDANRPVTDKWALVVGVSKFSDPAGTCQHF